LTVRPDVASSGITILALGSEDQNSDDQVPSKLRLDRCHSHGNPVQNVQRGIALNSRHTGIVGCYLADFHHELGAGNEAQAIAGWKGPSSFLIENCSIEAGDVLTVSEGPARTLRPRPGPEPPPGGAVVRRGRPQWRRQS